jgi:hypothetical protein
MNFHAKKVLLVHTAFSICASASAATVTHVWAFGEWPNHIGLIGATEKDAEFYTFIGYGGDPVVVPLHIYTVVGLATVSVLAVVFYLWVRHRRSPVKAA